MRETTFLGRPFRYAEPSAHTLAPHVPTRIPIARPPKKGEKAPLAVPSPRIAQRELYAEKALVERTFPRSPKSTWRKALAAGHAVRATYSVGPWMSADFQSVLEEDVPTIALWVIRRDRMRLRALWICRDTPKGPRWSFEHAWEFGSRLPRKLDSKEMDAWLTTK